MALNVHRSQWPRRLKCWSAVDRFLGFRVRILAEAWISISFECCVLSRRVSCDWPISRLEEFYRLFVCVSECVSLIVIMCNNKHRHKLE